MGVGIFAPALDEKGNSVAGIQVLERLSRRMYLSIFLICAKKAGHVDRPF